jgi:hypothetical protein
MNIEDDRYIGDMEFKLGNVQAHCGVHARWSVVCASTSGSTTAPASIAEPSRR